MKEIFVNIALWDATETAPPSYGAFHIIFTLVGFAICGLLIVKLRHLKSSTVDKILFGCGAFLILTEVYKQLFYYYAMDTVVHYHWWIFPFQLCSIPMYLCLLLPFLKNGKVKDALCTFMATYNLLGGFMAFIEPSGILHSHWTLTLHACIWHMMLNFIGLYLIVTGKAKRTMRHFLYAAITFVALACIAFSINLALRDISQASVNMFYVGPSDSPLAVFSTISKTFGWYVNTLLYIIALSLGAFLFFLPQYLYEKKKKKSKEYSASV